VAGWAKAGAGIPLVSCGSVGLDTDMFEDLFDHRDPRHLQVERDLRNVASRVAQGEFDLIGVGRAHVANSDFVRKVREGRFGEIELFNKGRHLARHVATPDEAGVVEKYRKVADDM
jgi:2,4-dienoyl-CoA reductase-like NADH-dependent reductase (Old Yellow Enzyme family)